MNKAMLKAMNEKIIIIPTANNLAKTLALSGNALFNTRILSPLEYAKELLIKNNKLTKLSLISPKEELKYIAQAIEGIDYFCSDKLADIENIATTLRTARMLIKENEEKYLKEYLAKGTFKEKNQALLSCYERYSQHLADNKLIDTIGLIRLACSCKADEKSEVIVLDEFPLSPLEYHLAGAYCQKSLLELFNKTASGIKVREYLNCYGSANEVAEILSRIANERIDECVVACADYSTAAQLFFEQACQFAIPIAYGEGIALTNTFPGQLLALYKRWSIDAGFAGTALVEMLSSETCSFPFKQAKLLKTISQLQLRNDCAYNDQTIQDFMAATDQYSDEELDELKAAAAILALPLKDFMGSFATVMLPNDAAALKLIQNEIAAAENCGLKPDSDIIEHILSKKVGSENSQAGKLLVTDLSGALTSLRKNLYIIGLSSTVYPGLPRENPLFLDSDVLAFGSDLTSVGHIRLKRKLFMDLLTLASSLGNQTVLSYPGLDVSQLKIANPSSLLFEAYKAEHGHDSQLSDLKAATRKIGYFEPALSPCRQAGLLYNQGVEVLIETAKMAQTVKPHLTLSHYSPSALNTFFNCPKQFYLAYLLGIPMPKTKNPFEVIAADVQGTLIHHLMEILGEQKLELTEFKKLAAEAFDNQLKITVPLVKEKVALAREDFVAMAENGWLMDQMTKRQILFKEEDKECEHAASGIIIHGYPDRVEVDENGKAVIVDFKSENRLDSHLEDDVDSCLQVLIYAYIVEKTMGVRVDHCEYHMLRFNDGIIKCRFDEEIRNALDQKLCEFKKALDNQEFAVGSISKDEEKRRCRYCPYGLICGKVVRDNE